ncbi:MAG: RNA polymerase sigma factor [Bacteroidota bacterium]
MATSKFIKAIVKGDPRARKQLYEQYKIPFFMICLRYGRDRSEAEDMLQEAFMVIFKDIGQYAGKGNFEGWMKRVVVNAALRYLRKWKRSIIALEDYVEEDTFVAEESYNSQLSLQELTQMIQQLPVGYRTVFNMYVIDGYTHKEISTYLNISEGTSKSQLSKARKLLRTMLEQQLSH